MSMSLKFQSVEYYCYIVEYLKMGKTTKKENLCKLLKWVLIGALVLSSGLFMSGVWNQYQAKHTSFMKSDMPR